MAMSKVEALRRSVEHWEDNVAAKTPAEVDISSTACALCAEFMYRGCHGCPVAEKAKATRCRDTPYVSAALAFDDWSSVRSGFDRTRIGSWLARIRWRFFARREVAFLKRLLREEQE